MLRPTKEKVPGSAAYAALVTESLAKELVCAVCCQVLILPDAGVPQFVMS